MELTEIKKFLNSGAGIAMKEYLILRLNELKNIDNVKEKDTPTHLAIELKSQKKAYQKLKEIMQDIITFSQEIKVRDPRDSYDVGID